MRHLILPILMLAIATHPAQAGRNQNGALVVHTNNMIIYTPAYYCETPAVPAVCEELDPNGTQGLDSVQLIWLLAAFRPEASPAVTAIQFGIEHNIPTGQGYFVTFARLRTVAARAAGHGMARDGIREPRRVWFPGLRSRLPLLLLHAVRRRSRQLLRDTHLSEHERGEVRRRRQSAVRGPVYELWDVPVGRDGPQRMPEHGTPRGCVLLLRWHLPRPVGDRVSGGVPGP